MTVRWYPFGHDEKPDLSPSEFSHGRGLRPKHLWRASPDDGGMYSGKSPSMNPRRKWRSGFPAAG